MAWTANVASYVRATDTATVNGYATVNTAIDSPQGNASTSLANGTGASQVDLAWLDTRGYTTTGTELDLTSLAAASTNTGAATFSAIKYLKVINNDSTNTLTVGNGTSTPWVGPFDDGTATVTIQPGGHAVFFNPSAAGWTTSSANLLKIAASANTTSATVVILGED